MIEKKVRAYLIGGPNHGSIMMMQARTREVLVARGRELTTKAIEDTSVPMYQTGMYAFCGSLKHDPDTGRCFGEAEGRDHAIYEWVGWRD